MKKGLDYFPLDCLMSDSVRLIEAQFGIEGFGILVRLWQDIYKIDGYYKKFDKDVLILFAKEIDISAEKMENFLKVTIARGIFDKKLFEKYQILTSKEIQKRFLKCTRKRKSAHINEEFLLLEIDDTDVQNEENGGSFKQSKVKESKVKKSKAEESKEEGAEKLPFGEYKNVYLTHAQKEKLDTELKADAEEYIMRLDEYIQETGKEYKDAYLTIKRWHRADSLKKRAAPESKKSKFANYTDANKYDYSDFADEVLNKLLEE